MKSRALILQDVNLRMRDSREFDFNFYHLSDGECDFEDCERSFDKIWASKGKHELKDTWWSLAIIAPVPFVSQARWRITNATQVTVSAFTAIAFSKPPEVFKATATQSTTTVALIAKKALTSATLWNSIKNLQVILTAVAVTEVLRMMER